MEITFSQLKQKEVVNLTDGKNLGKVCDVTFICPEYTLTGFTVTGCKGFRFGKQEIFIPMNCVVKIGEDTVLVKIPDKEKCAPPVPPKCEKRPPQNNCPPQGRPCPPPCPPQYPPDRRSYDEYE